MEQHQQQYDASLKKLIQEEPEELLHYLLEGAQFLGELNSEVFKPHPPLRTDKALKIFYRHQNHVFHVEFEVAYNRKMPYRMHSYNALLLEEYEWPVISMVLYPFRTALPEAPLRVMSGEQELLKFDFRIVPLWELQAKHYLDEHAVAMYPLLPTMKGANTEMLIQAIQEMAMRYNGDRLSRRLSWFSVMMRRAEMLPLAQRRTVEEHLTMFEELIDQDPYFRKREERAAARAETNAMQKAVLSVVQARFPALEEFAQEKVHQINKPEVLDTLVVRVVQAADEDAVRALLSSLAA